MVNKYIATLRVLKRSFISEIFNTPLKSVIKGIKITLHWLKILFTFGFKIFFVLRVTAINTNYDAVVLSFKKLNSYWTSIIYL